LNLFSIHCIPTQCPFQSSYTSHKYAQDLLRLSHTLSDIPITTPSFYADELECPDEKLAYVFRSSTEEEIPLLQERIDCLREAGQVLEEVSSHSRAVMNQTNPFRTSMTASPTSLKPLVTVQVNWSTSSLIISHASTMNQNSRNERSAS